MTSQQLWPFLLKQPFQAASRGQPSKLHEVAVCKGRAVCRTESFTILYIIIVIVVVCFAKNSASEAKL